MRFAEVNDHGVIVGRVDGVDGREHRLERVVGLRGLHRELHVLGSDGLTVMEDGALHEVERDAQTIVGDLPALSQVRLWLEVLVKQQRRRVELRAGHRRCVAGLHRAVQVTGHLGALNEHGATGDRAGVDGAGVTCVAVLSLFGLIRHVGRGLVVVFGWLIGRRRCGRRRRAVVAGVIVVAAAGSSDQRKAEQERQQCNQLFPHRNTPFRCSDRRAPVRRRSSFSNENVRTLNRSRVIVVALAALPRRFRCLTSPCIPSAG